MVDVYLEGYGSPAHDRLRQLIKEVKSNDLLAPITVIVPTPYAGISLRRSLSTSNGLVNVRFMVLPRLAEYIGSPVLAAQGKTPLTPIMELAAIRYFTGDMTMREPLGELASHPGLHISLRQTFRDLSRLSEDGLDRLADMDDFRAQIVDWYRLFRDLLCNHYDREELSRTAANVINEGKAISVLRDLGFVILHLVPDYSPGEMALVAALTRRGQCAVILGLTGEPETDALAEAVAYRIKPDLKQDECTGKLPSEPYGINHVLIAPDAREEVSWVIRHITNEAERGRPFHRMAVLYRQNDPYAHLIHSYMRFANIPIAGPDAALLKDTPSGKVLTHLLDAIKDDFSRASIMRWIAEAPVRTDVNGALASGELAQWETISREMGMIKGAVQWQERLNQHRDKLDQRIQKAENQEEISPSQLKGLQERVKSTERLTLFIQGVISSSTPPEGSLWSEYIEWAKGLLDKYAYNPVNWPQEHQHSYERLLALLDELGSLDGLLPGGTDLDAFCQMLNEILEAPAGRTGTTGTGVFVGSIAIAQAMDFDIIYIVGMAEGAFPPAMRDDPVLPDHLRKSLHDTESLPLRKTRLLEERRLYLAALAEGAARIISYPRADTSSSRGQYPSPWFINEVSRLNGAPVNSADIELLGNKSWLSLIHSSRHSLDYASTLAPADNHDYDLSSIARWREGGHHLSSHFLVGEGSTIYRALEMERARQGDSLTAWDGNISDLKGRSRYLALPDNVQFSPTRLERWAVCPFRYFLGDVLHISVLEKPEEIMTISPIDRGALLHDVMERFVKTLQEEGCLPDFGEPWDSSHIELVKKIVEEEFVKAEASGITGRSLLWELAKEEMRLDLEALLEMDSRWRAEEMSRPLWVERKFGFPEENSLPAVVLDIKQGKQVSLRGRIDRVDETKSGSKIILIDYKSGKSSSHKDMDKDELGGGKHLQLPVYAMALKNVMGESVEVEALYWFATSRGNFDRKSVRLGEVEERFHKMIEIIASGIEQGLFPANPGSADNPLENCGYCDFTRICPANRDLLWEQKSQSYDVAHYLKLRDLEPPGDDSQ